MKKKNKRKVFAALLSALMLLGTISTSNVAVLAEEPTPTPTATPAEEDKNVTYKYNGPLFGFEESFDNSSLDQEYKKYDFTSASNTNGGYTIKSATLTGEQVRDEDELTALGTITLGKLEGQKEDGTWVEIIDFGATSTSNEIESLDKTATSTDVSTTFVAFKYSGITDNSTGITDSSITESNLKLQVEFMPTKKVKVNVIDDIAERTINFLNVPYGFDIVESSINIPTHTGYDSGTINGTLTNITAEEDIHIEYEIQQYNAKISYNSTALVNALYDFGTKFTVLKKDGKIDKEYTLDENGLDEELTPITETGFDFAGFSYDDTTKTITPNYNVQTFTVTFVDLDGKTIGTPETVEYGKAATAPEAPEVEGYDFTKWDVDFSNVTTNLTVKPIYTQIMLKVYITSNSAVIIDEKLPWGATISIMNGDKTLNKKIEVKQEINQDLPTPEWIGHTFSNWTSVDDGSGDKVLTPNFVTNEYSVRFLDIEKNVLTTKRVKFGETVVAPTAPIVKGYIFSGWDKPLTGITEDCDIQAIYNDDPSISKYNVTFVIRQGDNKYGTFETATADQLNQLTVEKVIDGTMAGAVMQKNKFTAKIVGTSKFDGWYLNNVKVDDMNSLPVDSIMTFEARFYPDTNNNDADDRLEPVVVKFNTISAGTIPDQTLYVGATVSTPTAPSKSGYAFGGWYTSSSYATKWNFGDSVSQDMTLYAKWTKQVTPTPTVVPVVTATPSTVVPVITATPTVTSSTTTGTGSSATTLQQYLNGTTNSTTGSGTTTTTGLSSSTTSTAKPVVTINPTLYIHPTISFYSQDGFLEGTETMNYGQNIYVYDGNGNKLAEYSARQDVDIVLPEPGLIKNKVFSKYHVYWEDGNLVVRYEYLNDLSNGPIESATPSPTPTAETGMSIGTVNLKDWLWMAPWFLGGLGLLGIFIVLIKKLLKKDKEDDDTNVVNDTEENQATDTDLAEAEEEEELVELDDDEDFDDTNIDTASTIPLGDAVRHADDVLEPAEEKVTYNDPELISDSSIDEELDSLEDFNSEPVNEEPVVEEEPTTGVESEILTNTVETSQVEPEPIVPPQPSVTVSPTTDDVFENILKKYAKKTIKGGQ